MTKEKIADKFNYSSSHQKGGDNLNFGGQEVKMVVNLNGLPRKVRRWKLRQVYLMYLYRILCEEEGRAADPQEKKRIRGKQAHPQKKVERHMEYGEKVLKLDSAQMTAFNLAIIDEVRKGSVPKEIIRTLIKSSNGRE